MGKHDPTAEQDHNGDVVLTYRGIFFQVPANEVYRSGMQLSTMVFLISQDRFELPEPLKSGQALLHVL